MSEELKAQAGGVPQTEAGTGLPPVPAPGTTAPQAPATAKPPRVNLDEIEDFRRWKRDYDQKHVALSRQAEAEKQARLNAEKRMQEMEAQTARARLANADPEDIAKFYESEIARTRQTYEQQLQEMTQAEAAKQEALAFLQEVELAPETPGLDWSGGPTQAGIATLKTSAAKVLALQVKQAKATTATETQRAAQEARVATIQETGAAQVSTAAGGASPGLRAEFEAEVAKLRHSGRTAEFLAVKQKYRERGLTDI